MTKPTARAECPRCGITDTPHGAHKLCQDCWDVEPTWPDAAAVTAESVDIHAAINAIIRAIRYSPIDTTSCVTCYECGCLIRVDERCPQCQLLGRRAA